MRFRKRSFCSLPISAGEADDTVAAKVEVFQTPQCLYLWWQSCQLVAGQVQAAQAPQLASLWLQPCYVVPWKAHFHNRGQP